MNKRIIKYNPAFLSDDDLMKSFVARGTDYEIIMGIIRDNSGHSNQHVLIIGPRGSGKTMLVLRLALGLRSDLALRDCWFPIVFAEESYQVNSVGEFWLTSLFHLGEQSKDDRWKRAYDDLKKEKDDRTLGERALAQLMEFCERRKKRIVLFVENLNMMFDDQIGPKDAWVLRHTLLNEPRLMLVATATSRFAGIENADRAMFELFKVHELKPLDEAECRAVWTYVTGQEPQDERIRPLQILTGGNPRLLAIISMFGASLSFNRLMEDLMQLVDDHTEYFKSHLDNMAALERKVYLALAELWDPSSARSVAHVARLDVNKTSSLLKRLVDRGAVSAFDEGKRSKWYQVAERLYNIYYLMRKQGAPSNRVKAVVDFMINFYAPSDLLQITRLMVGEASDLGPRDCGDHYLAYESILRRVQPRELVRQILNTTPETFLHSFGMTHPMEDLLPLTPEDQGPVPVYGRGKGIRREMTKTPVTGQKNDEAEQALHMARMLKGTPEKIGEAEALYNRAIELRPWDAKVLMELGAFYVSIEKYEAAETVYRRAVEVGKPDHSVWENIARLLHQNLSRFEEAEAAYRKAIELKNDDSWTWAHLGQLLGEKLNRFDEAEAAYRKAIELEPGRAWIWAHLGHLLGEKLKRFEEAEAAYRKAIELENSYAWSWANLGHLLGERLNRFEEAEAAYRKAIELEPERAWTWGYLGHLLGERLNRFDEAEDAFRKAIELENDDSWTWAHFGQLLGERLNRFDEAEDAFRKAIELEPERAWTWGYLGHLLGQKLNRFDEAEVAYRKAIELERNSCWIWEQLGVLLDRKLGRYPEAETAYRKAIELEPTCGAIVGRLAQLAGDRLHHYKEAESEYRKAIELEPERAWTWAHLGQLLGEKLNRLDEAEAAFRKATELKNDDSWTWAHFGQLLGEKLNRFDEAEDAFRKAIELEPERAWTWAHLGQLLGEKLNRLDEAEAAFRKAIELEPDHWIWEHLGQLLSEKLNRFDEAEAAFRKAIELQHSCSNVHVLLGHLLYQQRRYEEAEMAYRKAIQIRPKNKDAKVGIIRVLLGRAEYQKAIHEGKSLLVKEKQNAALFNAVAWLFFKSQNPALLSYAEVWARQAVQLRPANASYHHTLASILTASGKAKEAVESARIYLSDLPLVQSSLDDAIELFVGLAGSDYADKVLELLESPTAMPVLEPLVVGIKMFAGYPVRAAAEVTEIGKDIAARIREKRNSTAHRAMESTLGAA
jgi:tetratricopeptide (TPR) repeat protein